MVLRPVTAGTTTEPGPEPEPERPRATAKATAAAIKAMSSPCVAAPDGGLDLSQTSQKTSSPRDKSSRSSFSSVRENDSDLAQTFTSTKVSSYLHLPEAAVDSDGPEPNMATTVTQFMPPRTQPASRLHGGWFPAVAAEAFQGWKQIDVKGRTASRSFGDLQALKLVWSSPAAVRSPPPVSPNATEPPPLRTSPGQSPIEKLPLELLGPIIDLLVLDVPTDGITTRNKDLMSLLCTSRTLHTATLHALYRNITIPHSTIYRKFLGHLSQNPELGTIVRRLDFSHFNPTSLFTTAAERATTQNLTPEKLLQCLELTPYLREFLGQEYIDDEIDMNVLRKLFLGLPRLQALDFAGCSSGAFKASMESMVLSSEWPDTLSISRLSFHKCINLPPAVFVTILPKLTRLTHLDVAGTRITDEALESIPETARLTHLNLAKCTWLSADRVVSFLTNHPAVNRSLVVLSVASDARSNQLLDVGDVTRLLPVLPSTLRSLSLKGSRMDAAHIDLLRPLTKHLEELALGRSLKISDIDRLFVPDEGDENLNAQLEWVPHTLKYIDLSDYWASELDLVTLFSSSISIMRTFSAPLEVIEVADDLYTRLSKSTVVKRMGWTVTEFGSRAWLVRLHAPEEGPRDAGLRSWKLGASFWGMRKIPVANAEVGGMYGSYMFKRKL